jgi:hypothetical protein
MARVVNSDSIDCALELTMTPLFDARVILTRPAVGGKATRGCLARSVAA